MQFFIGCVLGFLVGISNIEPKKELHWKIQSRYKTTMKKPPHVEPLAASIGLWRADYCVYMGTAH